MAFDRGSVPGGLSEEGKSARITQTRELVQSSIRPLHCLGGSEGEARFGCFGCPWAAGHDVRFVSFVSGATKQIHAASVRSGLRATVSEESNSLAFTTNLASVPVRLRPVLKSDSSHS